MPVVGTEQTVQFALMTTDQFMIKSRSFNFTFSNDIMITSVSPLVGGIQGGYTFVLTGKFAILKGSGYILYWNEKPINEYITEFYNNSIVGKVPSCDHNGRAEIRIEKDLVVYQNISVYFMYGYSAEVQNCLPNAGPTMGGTMVTFIGQYFNDQIVCEFARYLIIYPMRIDAQTLVCEMPAHVETSA